jgi:RimJ/RimL family protein N-acetyltransferase
MWAIEWGQPAAGDLLSAVEPTAEEIARAAPELAAFYNDPHNRAMMTNQEEHTAADVAAYYADLRAEGGRPLLLRLGPAGEQLMGDADLRNIEGPTGEIAILVGARAAQGRGLGTRYAIMAHAFAFDVLHLARVYAAIIPANAASRRVFEKLGYEIDDSPDARDFADEDSDIIMSIDRARFEGIHATALAEIRVSKRAP